MNSQKADCNHPVRSRIDLKKGDGFHCDDCGANIKIVPIGSESKSAATTGAIIKSEPLILSGSPIDIPFGRKEEEEIYARLEALPTMNVVTIIRAGKKLSDFGLTVLRCRFADDGKLDGFEGCKTWGHVCKKIGVAESTARRRIARHSQAAGKPSPAAKHDGSKSPKRKPKAQPNLLGSDHQDLAALEAWLKDHAGTVREVARLCPGLADRKVKHVESRLEWLIEHGRAKDTWFATNRLGQYTQAAPVVVPPPDEKALPGPERPLFPGNTLAEPSFPGQVMGCKQCGRRGRPCMQHQPEPKDFALASNGIESEPMSAHEVAEAVVAGTLAKTAETVAETFYVIRRGQDGALLASPGTGVYTFAQTSPGRAHRFEDPDRSMDYFLRDALARPRQKRINVKFNTRDFEWVRVDASYVLTPVA